MDVLPVGDGSGGLPEPEPPIATGSEQVLGEYLVVDGAGSDTCRRCNHDLATNATNWKWWALCTEGQVEPTLIHNAIAVRRSGELLFRRYFCPSCAVQIDTEVSLIGEPPRWNFRPIGVRPPVAPRAAADADDAA
jgi:hypothetical protein